MNLDALPRYNLGVTASLNSPLVTLLILLLRSRTLKKPASTCKPMISRLWAVLVLAVMGLCRCTFAIPMVISSSCLFGRSSYYSNQKGGGALHCCRLMMAPTRLANAAVRLLLRSQASRKETVISRCSDVVYLGIMH